MGTMVGVGVNSEVGSRVGSAVGSCVGDDVMITICETPTLDTDTPDTFASIIETSYIQLRAATKQGSPKGHPNNVLQKSSQNL